MDFVSFPPLLLLHRKCGCRKLVSVIWSFELLSSVLHQIPAQASEVPNILGFSRFSHGWMLLLMNIVVESTSALLKKTILLHLPSLLDPLPIHFFFRKEQVPKRRWSNRAKQDTKQQSKSPPIKAEQGNVNRRIAVSRAGIPQNHPPTAMTFIQRT